MTPADALRLGRVSNLPTVWTNVLAALALSGAPLAGPLAAALMPGLSLFYVAGMYLNDAFDAPRDARERPGRPIPAGRVRRGSVFALGFGGLAAGVVTVAVAAAHAPDGAGSAGPAALTAVILAGTIVLYDAWHKDNPLAPVLMGFNRLLVYATVAAAATGGLAPGAVGVGALLACHVIGLTYAARQEHLDRVGKLWPLAFLGLPLVAAIFRLPAAGPAAWLLFAALFACVVYAVVLLCRRSPPVGRAVVTLIAAISLFDALWLALAGVPAAAGVALGGFVLTLALQRHVPGT